MSKISNVITMLKLLESGRKYSLKELAEQLETSERMVRFYKESLEEAGIYIDTLMGPYGGYVLNEYTSIPKVTFSKGDLDKINKLIKEEKNDTKKEYLKTLEDKIKCMYLDMNQNLDSINLNLKEQAVFNKLSLAIKKHYKVRITYYNLQHGESIRTIYPLGMYLLQNEWWVSAFWEEKEDMRQFHITRIYDCDILSENFNEFDINIKF